MDEFAASSTGINEIQPGGGTPRQTASVLRLAGATDQFLAALKYLNQMCRGRSADRESLQRELQCHVGAVEEAAMALEREFAGQVETLRYWQAEFRRRTQPYFSQSYFMNRARTWPRGYPGDHEIIERAYDNRPLSSGLGELLDRYFLNATLARGIRRRREKMRELLELELRKRPQARVLNVGCGPCREVVELAEVIRDSEAHFTCLDFDQEALDYSRRRLQEAGIEHHVEMRRYNALRLVNGEKNLHQFGPQDVIYSIGLLDYLSDDVLIRQLAGLHQMLTPKGVLIAVFKDSRQYQTADYHWLVDWTGFLQRTAAQSEGLMDKAGLQSYRLPVELSADRVMRFYRLAGQPVAESSLRMTGPHRPARPRRVSRPSWLRRLPNPSLPGARQEEDGG